MILEIDHTCVDIFQERGTATEPPPRATFSGNVTQWEIYDAYQEDFEKQVRKIEELKLLSGVYVTLVLLVLIIVILLIM